MKGISISNTNAIRVYTCINDTSPNRLRNNILSYVSSLIEESVFNNKDDVVISEEKAAQIKKFLKDNNIDLFFDKTNDEVLSGQVKVY